MWRSVIMVRLLFFRWMYERRRVGWRGRMSKWKQWQDWVTSWTLTQYLLFDEPATVTSARWIDVDDNLTDDVPFSSCVSACVCVLTLFYFFLTSKCRLETVSKATKIIHNLNNLPTPSNFLGLVCCFSGDCCWRTGLSREDHVRVVKVKVTCCCLGQHVSKCRKSCW